MPPAPVGAPATYFFNQPTTTGTVTVKRSSGTLYGILVTVSAAALTSAVVVIHDGTNNSEPIVCPPGDTRGFMLSGGITHSTDIVIEVVTFPTGGDLRIGAYYL